MLRPYKPGTSHDAGRSAEDFACRYLERSGLSLLQRNYRGPRGEIDLVMRDQETLVFVEVRYRTSARFGGSLESVDRLKRERLISTARHYLQGTGGIMEPLCRFDVIAVAPAGRGYAATWVQDAFTAD